MTPNADSGGRYRPTAGGLFSGIGGLELGLERAGFDIVWHAETDPYASRVLKKHWPDVPNLGDVTKIDWSSVERPDLVCGGYPCQPFSYAGTRQGENDPRHLWPHMLRAIHVLRPDFALLENVPGHLSLGFGTVLADLASIGYDTEWECIPAAALGAPHLRRRIFIVADPSGGRRGRPADQRGTTTDRLRETHVERCGKVVADTDIAGLEGPEPAGRHDLSARGGWWTTEPDVGRVAHGIPNRVDRLRCLGNAVVPQVAEYVGRCILDTLSPNGRSEP
jgi:DNA (cytosine-5)-methyltransferase 1